MPDGRVQDIVLANVDGDGAYLAVSLTESRGGQVLRAAITAFARHGNAATRTDKIAPLVPNSIVVQQI